MAQETQAASNAAFVVTRTIPVSESQELLAQAIGVLESQPGINSAIQDKNQLQVRYDASRIGFWEIESILDGAGVKHAGGLGWRIKSEWFRFTDRNAQSNAQATPACCSRPPVAPGSDPKK